MFGFAFPSYSPKLGFTFPDLLRSSPAERSATGYPRCPHCDHEWHGLPLEYPPCPGSYRTRHYCDD